MIKCIFYLAKCRWKKHGRLMGGCVYEHLDRFDFWHMYIYIYTYTHIHILGISTSPLTFIFFSGVGQPPTSWYEKRMQDVVPIYWGKERNILDEKKNDPWHRWKDEPRMARVIIPKWPNCSSIIYPDLIVWIGFWSSFMFFSSFVYIFQYQASMADGGS